MSVDRARALIQRVSTDEEFARRLIEAPVEDRRQIIESAGFGDVRLSHMSEALPERAGGELSDEEFAAVAGGKGDDDGDRGHGGRRDRSYRGRDRRRGRRADLLIVANGARDLGRWSRIDARRSSVGGGQRHRAGEPELGGAISVGRRRRPERRRLGTEARKASVERRPVDVASHRCGDDADRVVRRVVVIGAQLLHLASHGRQVGEGLGLCVDVPAGDEDRTCDRRERVGERSPSCAESRRRNVSSTPCTIVYDWFVVANPARSRASRRSWRNWAPALEYCSGTGIQVPSIMAPARRRRRRRRSPPADGRCRSDRPCGA